MTVAASSPSRWRRVAHLASTSRIVIWCAFVLTHLWLGFLNFTQPGLPLGDVVIQYRYWAEQADLATYYQGIDRAWVYPIVALLPIVAAGVFGFAAYAGTWLGLVFLLDLIAFAGLVGWRPLARPATAGWWWIAFLILLGPIALGRIDSISVPVSIVAVLFLASRPRLAAVLLTLATWIKVWPAAIIAAILVASRARLSVILSVIVTSGVIIATAAALGAGKNVFSFITQQTARGLQVESPASTVWMWMSFAHVRGAFPYYDQQINTFEVTGPDSVEVASLLNTVFALVVLVIAIVGIVAAQRGALVTELLAPLALAFVTAFIAFNKVGSPQYMTWLAVPIILGLVTRSMGFGRSFRFPAVIGLVIAALTQVFYPVLYVQLLQLSFPLLVDLTVRNILVLVLFGWSVGLLIDLSRPYIAHDVVTDTDAWLPAAWPFELRTTRGVEISHQAHTDEDPSTS